MGTTKTDIFQPEQIEIANLLKAMAHPARIAILEYLIKANSCICGDIVDEIGLAQATVSQHLKELKKAGIIKGDIEGRKVCYCINPKQWTLLKNLLNSFLNKYQENTSCC